ncbi:hypothetical protein M3Y99_00681000 [Aphelenchoides fujianensis]|nr:hypothetical protein M3Y99_00681000 [Aphelenchoides fujianensis]
MMSSIGVPIFGGFGGGNAEYLRKKRAERALLPPPDCATILEQQRAMKKTRIKITGLLVIVAFLTHSFVFFRTRQKLDQLGACEDIEWDRGQQSRRATNKLCDQFIASRDFTPRTVENLRLVAAFAFGTSAGVQLLFGVWTVFLCFDFCSRLSRTNEETVDCRPLPSAFFFVSLVLSAGVLIAWTGVLFDPAGALGGAISSALPSIGCVFITQIIFVCFIFAVQTVVDSRPCPRCPPEAV